MCLLASCCAGLVRGLQHWCREGMEAQDEERGPTVGTDPCWPGTLSFSRSPEGSAQCWVSHGSQQLLAPLQVLLGGKSANIQIIISGFSEKGQPSVLCWPLSHFQKMKSHDPYGTFLPLPLLPPLHTQPPHSITGRLKLFISGAVGMHSMIIQRLGSLGPQPVTGQASFGLRVSQRA